MYLYVRVCIRVSNVYNMKIQTGIRTNYMRMPVRVFIVCQSASVQVRANIKALIKRCSLHNEIFIINKLWQA